ncbi:MAG: hypothetical protein HQL31_05760 [Planctomycetes bacterium]|nr:hypothetical protein [Planctomycetota bacterium]
MPRSKEEINQRNDARNTELVIPCFHCKNLISAGSQFSKDGWTCKAFPDEILYGILTMRTLHTELMGPEVEEVVFDPDIYEEEDGRKWHYNADGSWQYVEKS